MPRSKISPGARTRHALLHEATTRPIIGCFYDVYEELKYGLPEPMYATALAREIAGRGMRVEREAAVDVRYRGSIVGLLRLDLRIDGVVILELKAGPVLDPFAERQLYNYLRWTDCEVGLVLHFGPEPAFKRIVHTKDRR